LDKRKIGIGIIVVILLIIATGFSRLLNFATNYLWFREVGYTSVFLKKLYTQLEIGIPTFVIIMILTSLYLMALKRGYYKKVDTVDTIDAVFSEKTLNKISYGLAAIFAFLITFTVVSSLWFEILKFVESTAFGIADPIFGNDIGFYVFRLEFITQLNSILIGVIIGFAVLTLVCYFMLLSMRRPKIFQQDTSYQDDASQQSQQYNNPFGNMFGGMFGNQGGFGHQRPRKQFDEDNLKQLLNIASKQLIALGVIFFLMVGVNFFLRQYSLLYSHTGVLYGAGFTDININLWVYRALVVLSILAAIGLIRGMNKKKYKSILVIPVIMIILGAAGTGGSMLVQNLIVAPDEINKEWPYLEHNIEYTQAAYDLKNVTVKPFAADNSLTQEDIQNNMGTISNIRINDYEPARKFYNQTQGVRLYYTFADVDVDRYMINGEYTQVFLSAREIDENEIRQEWINRHLKYTHGYGVTLSRVDTVTASGQPEMLIRNIPPVSRVPEIDVDRSEIYFGELTNNYILVGTDEEEFDYPSGDNNIYTMYEGTAGIKLNPINRLLFAIKEQSLKLLVSTNINSDSRIIINRNIADRIQSIMPFLEYDSDPYVVIADGKLYWMLDAYTTSSYYPYSEPFSPDSKVNYIRNSVKVVVDAYNGDVDFYLVDDKDPVVNTYAKIYPGLFKEFNEMPESLRAHIRYPNVLFNIQAHVYKRYHMDDVRVFYQGEDLWDFANEIYGTEETVMTPNYYILKLPGENEVEFINSIPYTPRGRRNLTGLLVARNDGENYGELILYQMPKERAVYGPMQIESQIDQHPDISKEFSLWNSLGSTYIRGNMFVIPIEESLVYVEPVYLEAANVGSLPEVKRVIVAYGDRIVYRETLAEALDTLFGNGAVTPSQPGGAEEPTTGGEIGIDELIIKANEAFEKAEAAQRNGDWAAYGRYQRELQDYLRQLMPDQSQTQPQQEMLDEANMNNGENDLELEPEFILE
jgi:uncharacterized membrane protein (UPF0182 family)